MITEGIAFSRALQLHPFIALFEQRGGKLAPVLKAAGLEHFDLSDPATLITGNALNQTLQEMAEALADPYFAARAAEAFVNDGPLFVRESYAAAQTLAEFLPLSILELNRQISSIRYSIQVNADVSLIRAKRTFRSVAPIVQADAALASMWVTFLRLVMSENFDLSRILVTAREDAGMPPDLVPRSSFLKREYSGVQIGFPSEWLRRRLTLDWNFPTNQRGEFTDTSPRETILQWIEKALLERIGERPFGINDLANQLGVHPKSLQRTLAGFGTSFQEIRDNLRREKALEILSANKTALNEELAEALGFSSAASFSRAFKKWTGAAPSEYRKDQ